MQEQLASIAPPQYRLPGWINDQANERGLAPLPFADITAPTLIALGTNDAIIPLEHATNARSVPAHEELVPLLAERASPEDPSRVINIGSVDGLVSPEFESYSYSASKAAVHMLTRHLARHLVDRNITVNAIAPGLIEPKMTAFMFRDPGSPRW